MQTWTNKIWKGAARVAFICVDVNGIDLVLLTLKNLLTDNVNKYSLGSDMEFKFVEPKLEKTVNQIWNTLIKIKNYCIASSFDDLKKSFNSPHLKINSQIWIFNDKSIKNLREFIEIVYFKTTYKNNKIKEIATYDTIYKSIRLELELEITNFNKGISKRNFNDALTDIFSRIAEQIKNYECFFILDGLELQEINKISFGNIKIVKFDDDLTDKFYQSSSTINPSYAEHMKKNSAIR
ncbi:hypothetical protein [Nostoc sp.]|uniref:hypothetical protein n=1 Tax=Nostoc sp. TaxID=1180 RepID=UPI002FF7C950